MPFSPETRRTLFRLAIGCFLLFVYTGSYLALTLRGEYVVGSIGLNGPKSYRWSPMGFKKQHQYNRPLAYTFLPLYFLDLHYWHSKEFYWEIIRDHAPLSSTD